MAKLGGADVELNPTSSDFGKIRVGQTRWDIWGGHQQLFRAIAQASRGERKAQSGRRIATDEAAPFVSFLRNKLHPSASSLLNLMMGEDMLGRSTRNVAAATRIHETFIPLFAQDLFDATWYNFKAEGVKEALIQAPATGIPAFLGVGVQTFETPVDKFVREQTRGQYKRLQDVPEQFRASAERAFRRFQADERESNE